MNKKIEELTDGQVFKHNNIDYKKIPLERVSCCRSFNACQVSDANQKIMVKPGTEVEVND